MTVDRENWLDHLKQVVRSRHYTWLPEGLAGESVDTAMIYLTTDIMHICRLTGISFEDVVAASRKQYEREQKELDSQENHE